MEKQFKVRVMAKVRHGALIKLREELGWSQTKLADYLGVSVSTIVDYESLKHCPRDPSVLFKLCELTGSAPEELFPSFIGQRKFQEIPKSFSFVREIDPSLMLNSPNSLRALPAPDESMELRELKEFLSNVLEKPKNGSYRNHFMLSGAEIVVLREYFKTEDDNQTSTFSRTAKKLGISSTRVRQIFRQAIIKIRKCLAKEYNCKPDEKTLRSVFKQTIDNLGG